MLRGKDAATRNAFALAGLRIAVGCLFLIFAQYKVFSTKFTLGGGFQSWINRFLQDGAAYPFMVPVLNDFVLPHLLPSHSLPHSENSRLELLYFRASASGSPALSDWFICSLYCFRRTTQGRVRHSGSISALR